MGLRALLAACTVALAGCGGGGGGDEGNAPVGTAAVTLTWTAPSDARIRGYRVYYGLSSRAYLQARGSGLNSGSSTSFAVSGLAEGRDYYFAVTAYDAAGNESDYSSEVTKQVE
jgi:hypothetical protein